MSNTKSGKKEFSNEVNEKLSSVFQAFAVNPVNQSTDDRITTLEKRIFESTDDEPSLEDNILNSTEEINRRVKRINDALSKMDEQSENLSVEITSAKNAIIANQNNITENEKEFFSKLSEQNEVLRENIKSRFRNIDDLLSHNTNTTNDIFSIVKTSYEDIIQALDYHTNSVNSYIESTLHPLKTDIEATKDVVNKIDNNIVEFIEKNKNLKKILGILLATTGTTTLLLIIVLILII
ncbi:MAG: hypothetical protein E7556_07435 [Ruminococcaceae bacterium]|nr:hypothetical protein [Oscillospiraceae bacterium]